MQFWPFLHAPRQPMHIIQISLTPCPLSYFMSLRQLREKSPQSFQFLHSFLTFPSCFFLWGKGCFGFFFLGFYGFQERHFLFDQLCLRFSHIHTICFARVFCALQCDTQTLAEETLTYFMTQRSYLRHDNRLISVIQRL